MTFLDQISQDLHDAFGDRIERLCLVVPSRRAVVFLKQALARAYRQTLWAPRILAIQDLIRETDGRRFPEVMPLIFELYRVYQARVMASGQPGERFEQFYSWGEMLVRDFDEVDKYCVDVEQLFTNVHDLKELELTFALEGEHLEAIRRFWQTLRGPHEEPSEVQRRFLRIWELLKDVYQDFRQALQSRGLAYDGMAYRSLAERVTAGEAVFPYEKLVFIGFNALSTAEERIMGYLLREGQAIVYWDVDRTYFTPPGEAQSRWTSEGHLAGEEPGKFIRHYHEAWRAYDSRLVVHDMAAAPKDIYITGVALQVGQARYLGNLLRAQPLDRDSLSHHAVILADEGLLFPTLYALPDSVAHLNVTMGFPLRQTHVYHLLQTVLRLVRQMQLDPQGQWVFPYREVLDLLRNPLVQAGPGDGGLAAEMHRQNLLFIARNRLQARPLSPLLQQVFAVPDLPPGDGNLPALLAYTAGLFGFLLQEAQDQQDRLAAEYLFRLYQQFNLLHDVLTAYRPALSVSGYIRMVEEVLMRARIPFEGEPLEGLQLMGFLETRVLDFDHIYILGANEGSLPDTSTGNSFIPYHLRKGFGLPTYEEKDAIYAYHFYRLLQRAQTVHLIYNTVVKDQQGGAKEVSRFIRQIRHFFRDHPHLRQEERLVNTPAPFAPGMSLTVPASEATRARLLARYGQGEKGLSATSLNSYRSCSLQFYFRYVAGLRETEEIEETIEGATFGQVLHTALDKLYQPLKGVELTAAHLEALEKALPRALKEAFATLGIEEETMMRGKNLLLRDALGQLGKRLLEKEKDLLPYRLRDLENSSDYRTQVPVRGHTLTVEGTFDRIDEAPEGRWTRIVDYKTGRVELSNSATVETVFVRESKHKEAFQGFLYAWLYRQRHPGQPVKVAFYPFRKLGEGLRYLGDGAPIAPEVLDAFGRQLQDLLQDVLSQDYTQTSDLQTCGYCPYRRICGR